MQGVFEKIKSHWLLILIALLPIWDIITYFFLDSKFGIVLTFLRFFLAGAIFVYSFIISKNKKQHYIFSSILLVYILGHILSCYLSGYINIYEDITNIFRILYMPILLFSFIVIFKSNKDAEKEVVHGINLAFFITIASIILSLITNSANYTYGSDLSLGVIGWFYNKNSQSLILVLLSMICGAYSLKQKKYYVISILIFVALYFNATKTAYISLIAFFLFALFYSFVELKSKKKVFYNLLLLILSIALFKYSPTYNNSQIYFTDQINKNEDILNSSNDNKGDLIDPNGNDSNKIESPIDGSDIIIPPNNSQILKSYDTLYRSFSLGSLIDTFGLEKVLKKYNYTKDAFILSNARTKKKIAASLIYDEENELSHLFGFEFTKINSISNKNGVTEIFDLENDFTALFYYCGFIGFGLYIMFILYILLKIIKQIFINFKLILKSTYMIWLCLAGLLLIGAEYTGALLRRPNANIYLAIILALTYVKFTYINKKSLEKKVGFLMLHLGYGGIESSTINTANELSKKYKVEIISLYNLKKNQANLLDRNIKITYLMNDEPNKSQFLTALKNKEVINILKEGLKACRILFLKHVLIKEYIKESNCKIIVSTRSEFSKILSRFKRNGTIAIAQEHHHHNNDKKYLKILKNNYKNIDYLFALTNSLLNDYKKILDKNKNIKIVLIPNMLDAKEVKITNLKSKNIISVGRLHPGKRVNELVDIVSRVKSFKFFYIIGDGEEYSYIKEQIKKMNMQDKIKLLGYQNQNEIEKYYTDSTVFVMASISEGLPMVLLEAMNHGIPCIAYQINGTEDIIVDDYNGYLISKRDKKEFINKLNSLLENEQKCEQLGHNALTTAQEYSPNVVIKKWYKILDKYI